MTELLHASGDPGKALVEFQDIYDVSPERAQLCLDTSRYTEQVSTLLTDREICLYVGIPFCPTRCDYCSFVSQSVEKSMQLIPPFLDALLKEIAATAEVVQALGLRVISVYFGGGTPTTLSAQQLDTLIRTMEQQFDLSQLMEFTVEAGRPDTITEEKLAVLKAHGVSRISVNPQTMSDAVLEEIGRKHTAADVLSALPRCLLCAGPEVFPSTWILLPASPETQPPDSRPRWTRFWIFGRKTSLSIPSPEKKAPGSRRNRSGSPGRTKYLPCWTMPWRN